MNDLPAKQAHALEIIDALLKELAEIAQGGFSPGHVIEKLQRFHERAVRRLAEFSGNEATRFKRKEHDGITMGSALNTVERRIPSWRLFLKTLREEVEKHPEDVFGATIESEAGAEEPIEVRRGVGRAFLGHGSDPTWKAVRDFLRDDVKIEVSHFEREPRAGEWNASVVLQMIDESSFAVIVATAEDELKDGRRQPRLNVIHEIGLCHKAYGLERVFILLEEGANLLSNLDGLQIIPLKKENVERALLDLRRNLEKHGLVGAKAK